VALINRTRTKPSLVTPLFLLVMASTLAYFTAVGIITPTLPLFVTGPLGQGDLAVGVTIGAFAASAVLLRPFVGRVSDTRGRGILIIGGGTLVGLSMLGYILGGSLSTLLVMRVLTGVGEAAFYVGAASVINDLAPEDRRGEAISYFSLALYGGLAIGPVIGESILEAADFTAVWIAAGTSSIIAGLIGLRVPDTRPPSEDEDRPTKIVNRRALLPGTVLATSIWGLATFSAFVPLYAQDLGMSGSRYVFVVQSAVLILIRSVGARLPDILGPGKSGRVALTLSAIGLTLMGIWNDPVGLYAGTVVYSVGHALVFPALMTLAIRRSPVSERGSVVGTFTAFFDLSFGVGAASAGAIASLLGYRGVFVGAGFVALAGLMLLFGYSRRSGDRTAQPSPAAESA
jgi:MFS family permease